MSDAQREILESSAKSQTAAHREVTRAKALLLAADGLASTTVAYGVGVSPSSVVAWRSRFAEKGLAKLGLRSVGIVQSQIVLLEEAARCDRYHTDSPDLVDVPSYAVASAKRPACEHHAPTAVPLVILSGNEQSESTDPEFVDSRS